MTEFDEPKFFAVQRAFTRYLRDPEHTAIPAGLSARRIDVYRHAVFANMERFMRDNFPRVRAVLEDEPWLRMVADYYRRHESQTPLFVELPLEYLAYLRDERDGADDPPYLYELAHFDWLETLLGADERRLDWSGIDPNGDLLTGTVVLNPIHELVTYRFPVHAISADFRPQEAPAQPTHIVAFRDRNNDYGILDLNPVSARLFATLRNADGVPAEHILRDIAAELRHPDPDVVVNGGLAILKRMQARDVILGTRA